MDTQKDNSDPDKTQLGIRHPHIMEEFESFVTMPGRRDRKPDGLFEPGDLIMHRYEVLSKLGQGGMGAVFKCFDKVGGIEIALKALPPELSHNTIEMEEIKENFQLIHNLHHPNIASVNNLELDNSNGNYYLIMECVNGEDLRSWLKRKRKEGTLTLADVLPVIRQVAAALDYAHKEGIIHRDVKPGNVMINAAGDVKVLDFGLAAQIQTSMVRVSMAYHGTSGTGPYMAPEQWRGKAQGAAADQYALAVMTYEMLAGHLPFESQDATVLREAVLTQTADPIKGLPAAAQKALARALAKEPHERFESCAAFIAALESKKVTGKRFKKKWLLYAAAAVIVIGAAVAGIYRLQSHKKQAAPAKVATLADQMIFDLPDGVKLELLKVEAGSFTMSKWDGRNFDDEKEHQATLTRDFYLGKTEVTRAQWQAIMESNPSFFERGGNYPVESVSWNDAMVFCAELNRRGWAPSGWKFTLPTETQWEYAAVGGKKSKGYNRYSGSNTLREVGWFGDNSGKITRPVGQKNPNELGFYDMSGNVSEWCLDDHSGNSNNARPEFSRGNDRDDSRRVIRGGSFNHSAGGCRSASRGNGSPAGKSFNLGFRVALVPERY